MPDGALDVVVVPRTHELAENFEVRRALPSRQRRMVGPFVFLDQMGPHLFAPGRGLDVLPHPHIGLATVTYLFSGEILHRDSVGSVQTIQPGDVNWMTAGRGVVHSERTGPSRQHEASLFGMQCWVALPRAHEEDAPSFLHTPGKDLPVLDDAGVSVRILAGSLFGRSSPIPVVSPLFQADALLQPQARLELPAEYAEQAIYVVQGELDLGRDGRFQAGQLLVLKPGKSVVLAAGNMQPVRLMLLGGEPMDGPRYLRWNFVSSSAERIAQAEDDWRQQRFAPVPDETEFIPMPDLPGKPVRYP